MLANENHPFYGSKFRTEIQVDLAKLTDLDGLLNMLLCSGPPRSTDVSATPNVFMRAQTRSRPSCLCDTRTDVRDSELGEKWKQYRKISLCTVLLFFHINLSRPMRRKIEDGIICRSLGSVTHRCLGETAPSQRVVLFSTLATFPDRHWTAWYLTLDDR